jgi:uncharacterized protein YjbJ (UPF0337 family)
MPGFLDKAKDLAKDVSGKAKEAVTEHADQIEGGITKAAGYVDDKTKGKYTDKISSVRSKAHSVVDKIAEEGRDGGPDEGPDTPPPG